MEQKSSAEKFLETLTKVFIALVILNSILLAMLFFIGNEKNISEKSILAQVIAADPSPATKSLTLTLTILPAESPASSVSSPNIGSGAGAGSVSLSSSQISTTLPPVKPTPTPPKKPSPPPPPTSPKKLTTGVTGKPIPPPSTVQQPSLNKSTNSPQKSPNSRPSQPPPPGQSNNLGESTSGSPETNIIKNPPVQQATPGPLSPAPEETLHGADFFISTIHKTLQKAAPILPSIQIILSALLFTTSGALHFIRKRKR